MFRIIMIFLSLILSARWVGADSSLMTEKHIFTPGESKDEKPPQPEAIGSAVEKDILFTGVLITPKGRFALMTSADKGKKNKDTTKQVLKQGDTINGMTIRDIGTNYVMLVDKNMAAVKVDLYKGTKARPAPPAVELKPESSAASKDQPAATEASPQENKPAMPSPPGAKKPQTEGPARNSLRDNAGPNAGGGEQRGNPFADIFNKLGVQRKQN